MTTNSQFPGVPGQYRPTAKEVDGLVHRASTHPLGTGFLINGALDSVAATFGVHAFVVDEARRRLRAAGPGTVRQGHAVPAR